MNSFSIKSLCLVAAALACCANAKPGCERKLPEEPKFISFDEFKRIYDRNYASLEEEAARKKLYDERVEWAKDAWHEFVEGNRPTYLGINRMSDWTEEALATMTPKWKGLSRKRRNAQEQHIKEDFKSGQQPEISEVAEMSKDEALAIQRAPPAKRQSRVSKFLSKMCASTGRNSLKYDLSKSECFSSIPYQGHCASDYILTSISLFEYIYCKQQVGLVSMSNQYLLDCGPQVGLNGCDGGNSFSDVSKFAHVMGIEFARNYGAYEARTAKCKFTAGDPRAGAIKAADADVVAVEPTEFENFLSKKIPLYLTVAVNGDFFQYKGGVDDGDGCERSNGRAMLLVGSGVEDGSEYWLLRGTLGRDWGQKGYYKLNKNNKCLMGPGYAPAKSKASIFTSRSNNLFADNEKHPRDDSPVYASSGYSNPQTISGLGF